MKKLGFLWMVFLAMVVSVGLAACSEDEDGTVVNAPQEFFGTWDLYGEKVTFNSNGTGVWADSDGESETFSYTYNNGTVVVTLPYGDTEVWEVMSLSSDRLVAQDSEGNEIVFTREDSGSDEGGDGGGDGQQLVEDADFDMSEPSTLDAAVDLYPEVSGKYDITDAAGSGYASIELLGDGHYILLRDGAYYAVAGKAPLEQRGQLRSPLKREYVDMGYVFYGTFEKSADGVYALDGFGTLEVSGYDSNGKVTHIILTDNANGTFSLLVEKRDAIELTGNTALLCGRMWQLVKDRASVWMEGSLAFDAIYNAAEDHASVYSNSINASPDEFFDFGDETTMQTFFSPYGTYLYVNRDGSVDVALWRWENEDEGKIYTYEYEGDEDAGVADVAFSSNRMTITASESVPGYSAQYVTLARALN